jgi:hypothetical protein
MDEMQVLDIVPVERSIFVPDVDTALKAWHAYQNLCRNLLDDDDYAKIKGKTYRKRGGWSKLRRAFNITTAVIDSGWEDLSDDDFGFYVTIRASFPDGRYEDGDGYCDSIEMSNGRIDPTRHNVRAKAMTRAKNRATSDLIGAGEVSAEEMPEGDVSPAQIKRQRAKQPARQRAKPPAPKPPANGRPLDPEQVKAAMAKKTANDNQDPVTEKQPPFLARKFQEAFADYADAEKMYHTCLKWLWGVDSSKKLTKSQAMATLDWLLHPDGPDETNDTPLHPKASEEARRIYRAAMKDAGQKDFLDDSPSEAESEFTKLTES